MRKVFKEATTARTIERACRRFHRTYEVGNPARGRRDYAVFKYAVKRVSHSWRLFAALLVATTIGTAFFAGINISTDLVSRQAANQALNGVQVDYYVSHRQDIVGISWEIGQVAQSVSTIDGVNGTEIISWGYVTGTGNLSQISLSVVGIQDNSLLRQGMRLESGSESLGANDTYVWIRSPDLNTIGPVGSTLTIEFTIYDSGGAHVDFHWNLTVKGVVSLSERGTAIAKQDFWSGLYTGYLGIQPLYQQEYDRNILLVSWDATFSKLVDQIYGIGAAFSPFSYGLILSLDRARFVNPYDIEGSMSTLRTLDARIQNSVPYGEYYSNDFLGMVLQYYSYQLIFLRFQFIGIAIPIFILAWFLGSAASGVSFNLRRREIGLLSARGFTNSRITRLFLTEAGLIGLFSGFIGFLIGVLLIPWAMGLGSQTMNLAFNYISSSGGVFTLISVLIFGGLLAILSIFGAARKAANMKTIDALKEYTFVEDTKKVHRSKLVWAAFILGTYKMIIWILGTNLTSLMMGMPGNIIVYIVFAILMILDFGLNYIGPFLFLYGAAKLITQGFPWLHRKIGSVGRRAFGETGRMATRNVRRNIARSATVAFLVALVVGYGMFVVTTSASEYDYIYRTGYSQVGADISADLIYSGNVTRVTEAVREITGVLGATYERSFSSQSGGYITARMKAVDPKEWLNVAYYENEWFRGADPREAFQSMATDNFTIILVKSLADYLNLKIGGRVSLRLQTASGFKSYSFKIVGFFGPDLSSQYFQGLSYYDSMLESFVPVKLLDAVGGIPDTNDQVIVKLGSDANLTRVIENVQAVDNVTSVTATPLVLESIYSNYLITGPQDVRNIGVALAVIGASLETAIMVSVTLYERRRELALLSVRGLSLKQTSSMLALELVSIVALALGLGVTLGMIMTFASIRQLSLLPELVSHRMVIPPDCALLLMGMIGLVLSAVIIPLLIAAKRGQSSASIVGRVMV